MQTEINTTDDESWVTLKVPREIAAQIKALAKTCNSPQWSVVQVGNLALQDRLAQRYLLETAAMVRELQLLTLRLEQLIQSNMDLAEAVLAFQSAGVQSLLSLAIEAKAQSKQL